MSLGNSFLRRLLRFRTPLLTPLAGVLCIAAACAVGASTNQDDGDQMAALIERVDEMSGGRLKEYITKRVEATNAGNEFIQFLEENPDGAAEYRRLLFSAVRREEDWSGVFVIDTAPRRFLLDTWIEAARPGGELRGEFLKAMASRDVERLGSVWKGLEDMNVDYSLYKEYLRMHPVEEAAPLVESIVRSKPLMAMDWLLDIYPNQLPDAEAVYDDHATIKKIDWKYDHGLLRGDTPWETRDAFDRLSRHDVWWVRLYAVSAMNKRGPFRLEHRLKALHDDPSEPVSRAAKAISPPKKQRGAPKDEG